jgi:hypothetical protein
MLVSRGSRKLGRAFRYAFATLAVASLVALGGCGKSDEDTFADKGNDICKELESRQKAATKELNDAKGLSDVVKASDTGRAVFVELRERTKKLDPPSDLDDEFAAYLADIDEAIAVFDELKAGAAAGDAKRLQRIVPRAGALQKKASVDAKKLGFDTCAK